MAFPALLVLVTLLLESPFAPPPSVQAEPSKLAAPACELRTVEGQLFLVGTTAGHEVWLAWGAVPKLSVKGGMEPALIVIVGNVGDEAVPFDPASVRVWERTAGGDKPVRTLSVDQVERKRRNLKTLIASVRNRSTQRHYEPPIVPVVGLALPSEGPRNLEPAPELPPRGTYRNADGPRVPALAPKPGGQLPDNAVADRAAPMGSGSPATLWAMRSTLMRPGIVERGTYYGGLIYLARARSAPLRVEVKVAGDEFRFELAP